MGTFQTHKNDRKGANLHTCGTCKGITIYDMIIMSKKDALRTLLPVWRASPHFGRRFIGVRK